MVGTVTDRKTQRSYSTYRARLAHSALPAPAGIYVVTELSPQQLAALPGGEMLKAVQLMVPVECWDESKLRVRCGRLVAAMQSHSAPGRHLAAPILITLCQQRPLLCSRFSANQVKLVSEVRSSCARHAPPG